MLAITSAMMAQKAIFMACVVMGARLSFMQEKQMA